MIKKLGGIMPPLSLMKGLITFVLFFSPTLWACKIIAPESIYLATDLIREKGFAYKKDRVLVDSPHVTVHQCTETALHNKYLMIGLGPEIRGITDERRGYSFTGVIKPSACHIRNDVFQRDYPFAELKANFDKRFNFMKNCIEVLVEHMGNRPLQVPKDQPGCTVKKIDRHRYVFDGGFCYFKPGFRSRFSVSFRMKNRCLTKDFYREQLIGPMELNGVFNFYTAGDASGNSVDLTALDSVDVKISVNPYEKLYPTSDDFGVTNPRWPGQWIVTDTFWGNVTLKDLSPRYAYLKAPLVVDNRCRGRCDQGICSTPCDFSNPVVGEYTLHEWVQGKWEYIISWYDGGVVPPQWQGMLMGEGIKVPKYAIREGGRYFLDVRFRDPKVDFHFLRGQYERRLGELNRGHRFFINEEGIGQITEIPEIRDERSFPEIGEISGVRFGGDQFTLVEKAIDRLREQLNIRLWPPFYEQICDPLLETCGPLKDEPLSLGLKFTVGDLDEERNYQLHFEQAIRFSEYAEPITLDNPQLPVVQCD